MKLDELILLISNGLGYPVNQSLLAECLGVTRQTISNRIKNDSEVTVKELKKAEEFFKLQLYGNCCNTGDSIVFIDYYHDVFASCGNGSIVFSSEKTKLPIASSLIHGYSKNKLYSIINATGNSMAPTIESGDKLVVEHWNGEQILDNKIYVFCYNSEFFVKRLSKNIDEIIIKSDNPEYRIRTIEKENINSLILVGRIVAAVKALD